MSTTLIRYTCQVCGGALDPVGEHNFKCRHCGSIWEKEHIDDFEKILEKFDTALREQRAEDLAKLARRRYEETRKENVSNTNLESICNEILNKNPDDFYSQFYLATCKEDYSLPSFLNALDVNAHYYAVEQMLEYLIRGLQARWIHAVSTLIEKAYKKNDIAKYNLYRTKLDDMAERVEEGIFEPGIPRDIFIAYSSQDMGSVNELLRVLEDENGLSCFVAARNLRHGSGAVENYQAAINTALENCKAVVFVSSQNSRSLKCEAMKELAYIKKNLPDMWRIELLINDYRGTSVERVCKDFFADLEYCTSPQQVADRYTEKYMLEGEEAEAKPTIDIEAEIQRKLEEALAKQQAAAEAKRLSEAEARRKFEEETRRKLEAEYTAKWQAETETKRKAEENIKQQAKAKTEKNENKQVSSQQSKERQCALCGGKRFEYKGDGIFECYYCRHIQYDEAERVSEEKRKTEAEAKRKSEAEAKRKLESVLEFKTIRYDNGTYEGTILNGAPHGKGKYTWKNGEVYEGELAFSKRNGRGKNTYVSGNVYDGDWVDNKRHGKCIYTFTSGSIYEGDFTDDKQTGRGLMLYSNGEVYEGDWLDGKRSGSGTYTSKNGLVYYGNWINDKRNGKGKITYANKDTYEGDWVNDVRHGKGKYTYANGDVYDGDWVNEEPRGKGKFTFANGEVYEGDWEGGKRNGKGKNAYLSGNVYVGDWVDNKRHGNGKFIWTNGNVYEGEWVNDVRHGKGTFTYANGQIKKGYWQNDTFIG